MSLLLLHKQKGTSSQKINFIKTIIAIIIFLFTYIISYIMYIKLKLSLLSVYIALKNKITVNMLTVTVYRVIFALRNFCVSTLAVLPRLEFALTQ